MNINWAKKQGGTGTDWSRSMAIDKDQNVITTGYFSGTVDFDPGPGTFTLTSVGADDLYISKFDSLGNFIWVKQFTGSPVCYSYALAVDPLGNILTTGMFYNGAPVDFDPGAGVFNMTASGNHAMFISKLDPSGNFVFAKMVGGVFGCTCEGNSIACDASGNICVAGTSDAGTVDYDPGAGTYGIYSSNWDAFVLKLDMNGNFNWVSVFTNLSQNHGASVAFDPSGNVITSGDFGGTVDFDPGPATFNLVSSSSYNDMFICKLSPTGGFLWAKQIGGTPNDDMARSVISDASGNVYATGYFYGVADFDPGPGTYTLSASGFNSFVLKLNSSGSFLWAAPIGNSAGAMGHCVAVDGANNIYSTGTFGGTVDFDPGPATYTLTTAGTTAYVLKLDTTGNFQWAFKMNIAVNSYWAYYGRAIAIAPSTTSNFHMAGYFSGTPDLDFGPGTYTVTSSGAEDIVAARYCQAPDKPAFVSGPAVSCLSVNNFSVPLVYGATSYSWALPAGLTGTSTTNSITTTGFAAGTISVTAINSCGGGSARTFSVLITPTLNVTVNTASICVGSTVSLIANGAGTYTWSTGANTSSISVTPSITTIYTVTGGGPGCVDDVKTTTITVTPVMPTVSVNSPTICAGQTATLTVSGASTYSWNTGSTATSFTVSPASAVNYTVTGFSGYCKDVKTTTVYVNALPTVTAGASGIACPGNTICLVSGGAQVYSWTGPCGFSSNLQSPCITGSVGCTCTYSVVGTNTVTGCSKIATVCFALNTPPTVSATTNNSVICVGQLATLSASGAASYTWIPGGQQGNVIVVNPTVTTTYSVTGTASNGCKNTAILTQSVSACTGISEYATGAHVTLYPNPNKGNFIIKVSEVLQLKIMNVLGQTVIEKELVKGTNSINAEYLARGIYYYQVYRDKDLVYSNKLVIE